MKRITIRVTALLILLGLVACGHSVPALSVHPPSLHVADAALAGGAPAMALQVSRGVLARNPRDVDALVRQGDALFALDHRSEAAASYDRALALNRGNVAAQLGVGRVRLTDDPAGAEILFSAVLAADPRNAAAANDLGIARDLQGRHAAAQEAYRSALAIAPDLTGVQVNLGLSMALAGDSRRAIDVLRPLAADANATPRIRQNLAVALALADRAVEARGLLQQDLTQEQASAALKQYQELRPAEFQSVE